MATPEPEKFARLKDWRNAGVISLDDETAYTAWLYPLAYTSPEYQARWVDWRDGYAERRSARGTP